MNKYIGLVISDIHVGVNDLNKLHNEYLEIFINKIKQMKKLDFLIVTGDFFDHKFYLNDKEATMSYIMLKELVLACKEKDAVIRIVYGTESHECNQYDILSLLKLYDKIDIIKYAKEEELLEGLLVLYLPEEHIINQKEYYKEFFNENKKYNYIFGHGVIREVMKVAAASMDKSSTDSKRKSVPIFSSAELNRICKGQTFFGHYHINQELYGDVFYVGSFSRWQFGESERKGFYEINCNVDKNKYESKFIENTLAETYETVSFSYDSEAFQSDEKLDEAISSMEALVDRKLYNNMRFIFNIPTDIENPESTIKYLKEKYKYNDNIKVEITNGYIEEKRNKQKEEVKTNNDKYSFIFDKNMDIENKISQFISVEYKKEVIPKNISNYLFKPLNEII